MKRLLILLLVLIGASSCTDYVKVRRVNSDVVFIASVNEDIKPLLEVGDTVWVKLESTNDPSICYNCVFTEEPTTLPIFKSIIVEVSKYEVHENKVLKEWDIKRH